MQGTLEQRLAKVFGGLHAAGEEDAAWSLRMPERAFKAGRDIDETAEGSDTEEEEEEPDQLMPDSMIDDIQPDQEELGQEVGEEAQQAPAACVQPHSAAFRRQFEREEEYDAFDMAGSLGWDPSNDNQKPEGTMEVLDDNVFDRMSEQRRGRSLLDGRPHSPGPVTMDVDQPAGGSLPGAIAAGADHHVQQQPAPQSTSDVHAGGEPPFPLPQHDAHPATRTTDAAAPAIEQQTLQFEVPSASPGDVHLPSLLPASAQAATGGTVRRSVFAPGRLQRPARVQSPEQPQGGPASTSAADGQDMQAEAAQSQHDSMQAGQAAARKPRQVKRVRFSDDGLAATAGSTFTAGSAERGAVRQQQGRGRDARRPGRGQVVLNWQRPGFVPDHVRHPERYTRYDLGETLTVGGGDQGAETIPSDLHSTGQQHEALAQAQQPSTSAQPDEEMRAPLQLAVGAGAVKFVKPKGKSETSTPNSMTGQEQPAGIVTDTTPSVSKAEHKAQARSVLQYQDGEDGERDASGAVTHTTDAQMMQAEGGVSKAGRGRRQFRTCKAEDTA